MGEDLATMYLIKSTGSLFSGPVQKCYVKKFKNGKARGEEYFLKIDTSNDKNCCYELLYDPSEGNGHSSAASAGGSSAARKRKSFIQTYLLIQTKNGNACKGSHGDTHRIRCFSEWKKKTGVTGVCTEAFKKVWNECLNSLPARRRLAQLPFDRFCQQINA